MVEEAHREWHSSLDFESEQPRNTARLRQPRQWYPLLAQELMVQITRTWTWHGEAFRRHILWPSFLGRWIRELAALISQVSRYLAVWSSFALVTLSMRNRSPKLMVGTIFGLGFRHTFFKVLDSTDDDGDFVRWLLSAHHISEPLASFRINV